MAAAAAGPRIQHLENRLNQAEQSNRALLEDLTRLQHEMKVTVRQNAQGLAEQREHAQRLEMTMRTLAGKVQQIEPRINATEKAMTENRTAMQQLVAHTKNVANAVSMGQQDMAMKKDASLSQLQELKAELNQQTQAKASLERVLMNMKQEIAQMKNEVDSQKGALNGMNQTVQMQMRMRDEPRAPTVMADTGLSDQIRQQLEARVLETTRLVRDLENRLDTDLRRHEMTERQMTSRMGELQALVNEQMFKRPSQPRDYDKQNGNINGYMSDADKVRLQARMSEVAEDVNKTMQHREHKIRDEMMTKLKDMEEMILEQQEIRMKREKTIREDFEDNIELTRESQAEELRKLREAIKKESQKHIDAIKEVDDAVGILEQQIESTNSKIDKSVALESKARKEELEEISDKLEDCEDRLRTGMASLQVAIGSLDGSKGGDINQIRKIMDEQVGEVREALMNNLDDIEQRTAILTDKISEHDKLLANKPAPAPVDDVVKEVEVDAEISEKLEKLEFSQERLKRTLEQMQTGSGDISDSQLAAVNSKLRTVEKDFTKKLDEESGIRSNQVHKLRLHLDSLKDLNNAPSVNVTDEEIDQFKENLNKKEISIKKLSEAIFVVKSILERRITNEMSDRRKNLRDLKGDVAKVGTRIGDNYFVKGGERNSINTWDLYTLFRWMKWKDKWIKVLYEDPRKKYKEEKKKRGKSKNRGNKNNR